MKVQYLLTLAQIRAISLLIHINGTTLPEEVNDKRLVEYDIPMNQILMLDSLLRQEGFIIKDESQWPSDGDEYYYISADSEILRDHWDMIDGVPSLLDDYRRNIGNIFKTRREARFEMERLEVLNQLKNLSDDDQVWDAAHTHYCIKYDLEFHEFECWSICHYKLPHEYWFKSEESAKAAIKIIGEDKLKKYIFNIKE